MDGKPAMAVSADGKEILLHLPQGLMTRSQVSECNLMVLKILILYRNLYTKPFNESDEFLDPPSLKALIVTVAILLHLMFTRKAN
jgi:hypothetical protein